VDLSFSGGGKKKAMYGSRKREEMRKVARSFANNIEHYQKQTENRLLNKRKLLPDMEKEAEQVRKKMKLCTGPNDIQTYLQLKMQSQTLQEDIQHIKENKDYLELQERLKPIMKNGDHQQRREAVSMSVLFPQRSMSVYIDTERCARCRQPLHFKNEERLLVCSNRFCRRTVEYLDLSTDHVDVAYFAQDNHANHLRSTKMANVDISASNNMLHKDEAYEKFIQQWTVPPPPGDVFNVLLTELSKVHMHHASKIQSTPIASILRRTNYKQYAWMSVRIAIMLRRRPHEVLPIMDETLAQKLLQRYQLFVEALPNSTCRDKKRAFNLSHLTKIFLMMEKRYDLSELFVNHKTRPVMKREEKRIQQVCQYLQKHVPKLHWGFIQSL
jgi:hypothetical protein